MTVVIASRLCSAAGTGEVLVQGVVESLVASRDGVTLDADEIRAAVKRDLARYKVPRDVIFTDELPRTATGKVLKRELRAQVAGREARS